MESIIQPTIQNQELQIDQIIKFVNTFYCPCDLSEIDVFPTGFVGRFSNVHQTKTIQLPYPYSSNTSESHSTCGSSPQYTPNLFEGCRSSAFPFFSGSVKNSGPVSNWKSVTSRSNDKSSLPEEGSSVGRRDMVNYAALEGHKYAIIPNPNKDKQKNTRVFVCKYDN